MLFKQAFVSLAFGVSAALADGNKIGHKEVTGWKETTVPDNEVGTLMEKYQPYLRAHSGCNPFPAVNSNGDYSGGLKPAGTVSGDCSSHEYGQVYAREGRTDSGHFAIMYFWYFPKDSLHDGLNAGHRHDWEGAIIWFKSKDANAKSDYVSVSHHGDWKTREAGADGVKWDGTHVYVGYDRYGDGIQSHSLDFTSDKGETQALVAWDELTDDARDSLETVDWGSANLDLIEDRFQNELEDANPDE